MAEPNDKLSDLPALADLPNLAEIFENLRRGRHICAYDGELYRDLSHNQDRFTALFAALGFELVGHRRDFYYFRTRQKPSEAASRMTLFVFILVEWLSSRGQGIEQALLGETFVITELPHFDNERHKRIMNEAGLESSEDLERVVNQLERFGYATRTGGAGFRFRPPVCRFLDICLEVLAEEEEQA